MQYGISWKMYICLKCYDERGENYMLHDAHKVNCQFCERDADCFDIPIHALKHWRDVYERQKNMPPSSTD